jgi:L-alanine-DL-glutamate epimerase-like enolase superfamily enzyme
MERNLELVRTLRRSLGPDVDIMLDAWSSWDVPYTIQMAERVAEYDVRWIEEPVLADKSTPAPRSGRARECQLRLGSTSTRARASNS